MKKNLQAEITQDQAKLNKRKGGQKSKRQAKQKSSIELGSDYVGHKTGDHTCPTVQLVLCSDVCAVDWLGGSMTPHLKLELST